MPLFFLLSGFCLTLGYGRTKYTRSTVCCGRLACTDACNCCRPNRDSDQESVVFDTHKFLFNRLSRILPVYYICFVIGIALTPTGHNQVSFHNMIFDIRDIFNNETQFQYLGPSMAMDRRCAEHWVPLSGSRLGPWIFHHQRTLLDNIYLVFLLPHLPTKPHHGSKTIQ